MDEGDGELMVVDDNTCRRVPPCVCVKKFRGGGCCE